MKRMVIAFLCLTTLSAFANCDILLAPSVEMRTFEDIIINFKNTNVARQNEKTANLGIKQELRLTDTGAKNPFGEKIMDKEYMLQVYQDGKLIAKTGFYSNRNTANKNLVEILKNLGCN